MAFTSQEKTLFVVGGTVLAGIVLAPRFFPRDERPPTKAELRERSRREKTARLESAREDRERDRREKALAAIDAQIQRLRDRSSDLDAERDEWEKKARGAVKRTAAATAHGRVARYERQLERLGRDLEHLDDLRERIERGAPHQTVTAALRHARNPSDNADLAKARAESERFHGSPDHVVELSEAERCPIGKYGVVLGKLEDISYAPQGDSERGGVIWDHRIGDGGRFAPPGHRKPLLVADPTTGHIVVVQDDAPTHFRPDVGILD